MSEANRSPNDVWAATSEMEGDVYDVRRWADVLIIMSASAHAVQPETLSVLGNRLYDLGENLREQFMQAIELSRRPI